MKKQMVLTAVVLAAMFLQAFPLRADVATNAVAPEFTLTDTNGQAHSLSSFKGKYVILEWVNYECPFVVKHYGSNNMQSLQKEFADKGVVWLSINSSAGGKQGAFSADEVNGLLKEKGASPAAYLLDTDGSVGKLYGAKTTPHMFVINPEGNVIYQGAIDSTPSASPADIANSKNYVKAAIDEAMAGKPVTEATTQSYGCSVKY